MKKRIECIVSGRVQGVLYRAFTKRLAESLDVFGTVENLENNTVKIEAEGEIDVLEKFKSKLWKGSTFSRVSDVSCVFKDDIVGYDDFKINYKNFFDRF